MMVTRNLCSSPARTEISMDRLFEDLIRGFHFAAPSAPSAGPFPAVNSREDEKSYDVELELPGFDRKDFEISVHGRVLEVSGERKEAGDESTTWHRRERHKGRFSRKLRLPNAADGSRIEARYANGVLTLTMPKAATELPRTIEIKG